MSGLKGYDAWKTASPDDEPGRTYSCDCCGKDSRNVEQCWTPSGLEAWACPACRGEDEEAPEKDWMDSMCEDEDYANDE